MTTPKMLRETANRLEVDPDTVPYEVLIAAVSDGVDRLRAAADEIESLTDRVPPPWSQTRTAIEQIGSLDALGRQIAETRASVLKAIEAATDERKRVDGLLGRLGSVERSVERIDRWQTSDREKLASIDGVVDRQVTRLTEIEQTDQGITEAFHQHDERIVGNHNRIATVEQAIANLPRRHARRLRDLEQRVDVVLDELQRLGSEAAPQEPTE
ncbi:MAG: hypothetical protein AAGA99_21165 [Actinomycetota bacterium]